GQDSKVKRVGTLPPSYAEGTKTKSSSDESNTERLAKSGECKYDGTDYPSWLGYNPFKKPGEPFVSPFPTLEGDSWEQTSNIVKDYDDTLCDAWVDEIQNILIFAGLFSAIVTAFAIETYQSLEADPAVATVLLLAQISNQLGTNSSIVDPIVAPFQEPENPSQAFRINALVFVSLILSLGVALVGIIALQWIRAFRKRESLSHRDYLSVRHSRYQGLIAWRVPEIITSLPLVLQLSLVIFFVALIDFLNSLNASVAAIVAAVMAITLLFVIFTTLAPGMYIVIVGRWWRPLMRSIPPYHSPQSWLFFQCILPFRQMVDWLKWRRWDKSLAAQSWTQLLAFKNSYEHLLHLSLAWFMQNFNSTDSFCAAYDCFQAMPTIQSADMTMQKLVSPQEYEKFCQPFKNMDPAIYKQVLSLYLLEWDRRRHPPYPLIDNHRMELSIRSMVHESPNAGGLHLLPTQSILPPVTPDTWTGGDRYIVPEAKAWLFRFLLILRSKNLPELSDKASSSPFFVFWRAIMVLNRDNQAEAVDDSLRVLSEWLSRLHTPNYYGLGVQRPYAVECAEQMLNRVVTYDDVSLFRRPSFLAILDHFVDHQQCRDVWHEAVSDHHETAGIDPGRWEQLLAENVTDEKYWVLAHDHERLQRIVRARALMRSSISQSTGKMKSPLGYGFSEQQPEYPPSRLSVDSRRSDSYAIPDANIKIIPLSRSSYNPLGASYRAYDEHHGTSAANPDLSRDVEKGEQDTTPLLSESSHSQKR
ncbi:hypothetical protein CVT24_009299, partial [Panaeolus cyanescens]